MRNRILSTEQNCIKSMQYPECYNTGGDSEDVLSRATAGHLNALVIQTWPNPSPPQMCGTISTSAPTSRTTCISSSLQLEEILLLPYYYYSPSLMYICNVQELRSSHQCAHLLHCYCVHTRLSELGQERQLGLNPGENGDTPTHTYGSSAKNPDEVRITEHVWKRLHCVFGCGCVCMQINL